MNTLPDEAELSRACVEAGKRGWTREEVRGVLLAHEASWKDGRLTRVPAHRRRALASALAHLPSWWRESRAFCAQLRGMGCSYAELAAATENLKWQRPSMQSGEGRRLLLDMLTDPDTDLVRELCEVRAAAKALRKRRAA